MHHGTELLQQSIPPDTRGNGPQNISGLRWHSAEIAQHSPNRIILTQQLSHEWSRRSLSDNDFASLEAGPVSQWLDSNEGKQAHDDADGVAVTRRRNPETGRAGGIHAPF